MKILLGSIFIFFIFFFAYEKLAYSSTLGRNLSLGMSGDDILILQKILNSDIDTVVSESGLGSSGNETKYFGAKTLDAVKRFQSKYLEEVLKPISLSKPNGFVGPLSRQKLELVLDTISSGDQNKTISILTAPSTPLAPSVTTATNILGSLSINVPELDHISPTSAKAGDTLTVHGKNFLSSGNLSVLFIYKNWYYYVWAVNVLSDTVMTVTVPTDLEEGSYALYVTNETEVSSRQAIFSVNNSSTINNYTPDQPILQPILVK